jgi:hypothetical protein
MACMHGNFGACLRDNVEAEFSVAYSRYGEDEFLGVAVDSACTGASVISELQYAAYCREYKAPMCINVRSRKILFGEGMTASLGTVSLNIHIFGHVEEIAFHLAKGGNIPALFSLSDLDRLKIDLCTPTRELVRNSHKRLVYMM